MANKHDLNAQAQKLRTILERRMELLPKDNEAILLSGGIDSSAIACLLLNQGRRLVAYTVNYDSHLYWQGMYDESKYVEMIASRYPNLEVRYQDFLNIDLLKELREFMGVYGEPIPTGSFLLQYLLFKRMQSDGIKKIIYCQWADELFGGYDHFMVLKARDDFRRWRFVRTFNNLLSYYRKRHGVQDRHIFKSVLQNLEKYGSFRDALTQSRENAARLVTIASKSLWKGWDMELFLPYVDLDLLTLSNNIRDDHLVNNGETKIVLKEAFRDIVPEPILERKVKYSFFAPDNFWLLANRDRIMKLEDDTVRRLYESFLMNCNRRFYRNLWVALSGHFLDKEHP